MPPKLETQLNALIRKCECAIRRGDVVHIEALHSLQQQLIRARDARHRSKTTTELQAAIQFYHRHIPATERTTTFAGLTEQFEQVTRLEEIAEQDASQAVDSTSNTA